MALTVEFAPDYGPLDVVPPEAWVDLSDRLLSAEWDEGRRDELEHHGPGQGMVVLKNDDRELDPDHTGGTWFGQLLPRVPFRIREDGADRFYGFVEGGFAQTMAPPASATCTVTLTDRLSAVAGVLPDVFEHAILSTDPAALWILDGPSGTEQVADLSGNGHDGTVVGNVKFGEPPITAAHSSSARFAPSVTMPARIEFGRSPIISDVESNDACAVLVTFRLATPLESPGHDGQLRVLFWQGNGGGVSSNVYAAVAFAQENPTYVFSRFRVPGTTRTATSEVDLADGEGHFLFTHPNSVFLDGTVRDTTEPTPAPGAWVLNGVGVGGLRGMPQIDHFDGWIGVVALWNDPGPVSTDTTMVTTLYDGYTKLAGKRSDEHVAWALERIGVPAGLTNLEAGSVIMGAAETRGKDALTFIREVVATEQGEFYCDHRDGGKLRFRSRYARFTDARSTTSQVTFSDDPSDGNAVRVERSGLDVAPNGIDGIVNQADVSWRGGTVVAEDADSVARFGPRGRTIETQATTAAAARSAGEWLVARYSQPRSRIRGLAIRPDASANALAAAQDLRVGDRVTYRSHPQEVGSAFTVDLFVEGVTHSCRDGVHRSAVYSLSTADTFTPWIWGTSKWDETTAWG